MALCSIHLNDTAGAEARLREGKTLLGEADPAGLEFPEEIVSEIRGLYSRFNLKDVTPEKKTRPEAEQEGGAAEPPTKPPAAAEPPIKTGTVAVTVDNGARLNPVETLERMILSNPRDPAPYYDLADMYRKRGDTKETRKVLQDLVLYNPNESLGHLLLGELEYLDNSFSDADKAFERVLLLSARREVDEETLRRAMAGLILDAYYSGKRKRAAERTALYFDYLEGGAAGLPLRERDIRVLETLLEEHRALVPVKEHEAAVAAIEDRIRNNPYLPETYAELFELFWARGDFEGARKTVNRLMRITPKSMNTRLMLARLEFEQKNDAKVLEICREILEAPEGSDVTKEIAVAALVYSVLSEYRMGQWDKAREQADMLARIAAEEEIAAAVSGRGLEEMWNEAMGLIRDPMAEKSG